MKILITLCARGNSKGIPGKNIKKLYNRPLIAYSIKTAELFKKKYPETDIFLSTDSERIKAVVKDFSNIINIEYNRPPELASDSAGKIDAIRDVLIYAEKKHLTSTYDYVIDLDVTSPLRTVEDIELSLNLLHNNKEALNIFSVNQGGRNPYFNMVERKNGSEFVELCKQGKFLTRQSAPEVFELNASLYIYKRNYFQEKQNSAITENSLIFLMSHTCFDLDNPIDFLFMEYLLENNKLDFQL